MKYTINGSSVMLLEDETLIAGSVGVYSVEFLFDDTWEEYTSKTAVFKSDTEEREVLLFKNVCVIPWEVLTDAGMLRIGIYGESSERVRPTLWAAPKTIHGGTPTKCESSVEPTPDKWQQAIAYIESLISPTVTISTIDGGHRITVRDVNGERRFDIMDGEPGYTPQKGVDYFDGKTPVKGVDYFDGEPGYTPQKGVDYFDGKTPVKGEDYYTDTDKAEMVQAVLDALPNGDEVNY